MQKKEETKTVHVELLEIQAQLSMIAGNLYDMSVETYHGNEPETILMGASFTLNDINTKLKRITSTECTDSIQASV